jgi:hypothetical protein
MKTSISVSSETVERGNVPRDHNPGMRWKLNKSVTSSWFAPWCALVAFQGRGVGSRELHRQLVSGIARSAYRSIAPGGFSNIKKPAKKKAKIQPNQRAQQHINKKSKKDDDDGIRTHALSNQYCIFRV